MRPRYCCIGRLALAIFLLLHFGAGAADPDLTAPPPLAAPAVAGAEIAPTNSTSESQVAREAIEQLRRDLERSSARNADAITAGLSLIEPALARMQERQMESVRQTVRETVRSSNQTILLVAGIFAAVGFLGLALISMILVRAIGRFSEMAMASASRSALVGGGQALASLHDDPLTARAGVAEQVSGRFHGAIEQLQRRIHELEQSLQPATPDQRLMPAPGPTGSAPTGHAMHSAEPVPLPAVDPIHGSTFPGETQTPESSARVSVLLGKGQALLSLDSAEEALQCFEEALAIDPDCAETLVKKGMALEKMQDWDQALQNYNRAIAIDHTLTVAYLYRGGVYNRLQRYREALESYEQALRTEKTPKAS